MHKLNRKVFFDLDAASPLLRLYGRLVALELTLKDDSAGNYARGHDVAAMVINRGDAGLSAKAYALNAALASLHCTDIHGNPRQVDPRKYPHIRYLRHETDFPGTSTDIELQTAIQVLEELFEELRKHQVIPC